MTTSLSTYDWFIKKDFSNYAGKWIAIVNKEVIASGKNVNDVLTEAKKEYPTSRPFLAKVRNKLSIL